MIAPDFVSLQTGKADEIVNGSAEQSSRALPINAAT
jgi:hypothetical protein